MKNTKKLMQNIMRGLTMVINKKYLLFLCFLIPEMVTFGESFKALPSVVIEQKNGTVEKFEDDIFERKMNSVKRIY